MVLSKTLDQKGFSLMELMVAVAIIAVLSAIGLPSYKTFQAKARQKEGFNLLSGFYAATISTKTEFGVFAPNLVAVGYAPVGTLNYRFRQWPYGGVAGLFTAFTFDGACTVTSNPCNCGGNCPNFKTWTEAPGGVVGSNLGPVDPLSVGPCPTLGGIAGSSSADAFVVGVAGVISTSASQADGYYMDQNKTMEMCSDGLK